jgi:hypothetical protein
VRRKPSSGPQKDERKPSAHARTCNPAPSRPRRSLKTTPAGVPTVPHVSALSSQSAHVSTQSTPSGSPGTRACPRRSAALLKSASASRGTTPSAFPAPGGVLGVLTLGLGVLTSVLGVLTQGALRATLRRDAVCNGSCCTATSHRRDRCRGSQGCTSKGTRGVLLYSRGTQYLRPRRPSCASCPSPSGRTRTASR